jgi:TetR/AcrR family hemagglutinin/protease transcriptional regulator
VDASRKPRADRRRLKPDERRAQLLEAAIQVFARRGPGRGTHADVAEACGVVVGTVFLYFPTREALLAEVLEEVARESTAIAERCHVGKRAPESLRSHVRACLDLVERKPEYALIWLDWSTAVRDDVWPRYLAFQDRIVAMIAASIERGRRAGKVPTKEPAATCARLIVSSTQMLAQMHFTQQPRKSIETFADAVVDIALGLPHSPR